MGCCLRIFTAHRVRTAANASIVLLTLCALNATAQSKKIEDPKPISGSGAAGAGGRPVIDPFKEYGRRINSSKMVSALKDDLFGESVSLYNGSTEFVQTDIDIPGNNALPVRLARRLEMSPRNTNDGLRDFANWDADVPHIHAIVDGGLGWKVPGASPNARCSSASPPQISSTWFTLNEVWNGTYLHLPGEGDRELLKHNQAKIPNVTDGNTYPWITRDFIRIRCASNTANGYAGESFVAVTPSGITYHLNHVIQRVISPIGKGSDELGHAVDRKHLYFRATRAEDRFGNWVNYTYTGDVLTGISSNDGRQITLTINGGKVSTAAAAGRTWTYTYQPASVDNHEYLKQATLPDQSTWAFINGVIAESTEPGLPSEEIRPDCPEPPYMAGGASIQIKHPSNATGLFVFTATRHYRDGVPFNCVVRDVGDQYLLINNFFDVYALTSKTISGPGLANMTWSYDYVTGSSGVSPQAGDCMGCFTTRDVSITNPNGTKVVATFGATFANNEGQLIKTDTLSANGALARSVRNTYATDAQAASALYAPLYGQSYVIGSDMAIKIRPVSATATIQDGVSFGSTNSAFDIFARPTTVTRTTAPSP